MVIAGEASGDLLAAELVGAIRQVFADAPAVQTADAQPLHASLAPRFFGAGGPRMAAAGVELAFDLTTHSVIGLSAPLLNFFKFRRLLDQLQKLAWKRQPDAIICVDFDFFNRWFARSVKKFIGAGPDWFHAWRPALIKYVSPQVWASREGRAYSISKNFDLLLSLFPFEKAWYAKRVPKLRVEFVGHPLVDRYAAEIRSPPPNPAPSREATILLLPGSRPGELRRHLPVLAETAKRLAASRKAVFRMVLPRESLRSRVAPFETQIPSLEIQVGNLEDALTKADVAITKSGTVTLECALFGVPAVVFYKTSLLTYAVGKQLATVKYLAMPNLLADEPVYPEFIQGAATAENLARASLELLDDPARRSRVKARLAQIVGLLGSPGASRRAASAIVSFLNETTSAHQPNAVQAL